MLWLAGCGSSTASVADPFHTNAPHAHVGDRVHLGSLWIATITGVSTSARVQGQAASGGNTYLVVTIAFQNATSSQQTLYTSAAMVLEDAGGRRYAQANLPSPPLLDGPVVAGKTATGPLVFEVPATQRRFQLAYQGVGSGDGTAVWDLALSS
jgi:hypothetical protein